MPWNAGETRITLSYEEKRDCRLFKDYRYQKQGYAKLEAKARKFVQQMNRFSYNRPKKLFITPEMEATLRAMRKEEAKDQLARLARKNIEETIAWNEFAYFPPGTITVGTQNNKIERPLTKIRLGNGTGQISGMHLFPMSLSFDWTWEIGTALATGAGNITVRFELIQTYNSTASITGSPPPLLSNPPSDLDIWSLPTETPDGGPTVFLDRLAAHGSISYNRQGPNRNMYRSLLKDQVVLSELTRPSSSGSVIISNENMKYPFEKVVMTADPGEADAQIYSGDFWLLIFASSNSLNANVANFTYNFDLFYHAK